MLQEQLPHLKTLKGLSEMRVRARTCDRELSVTKQDTLGQCHRHLPDLLT